MTSRDVITPPHGPHLWEAVAQVGSNWPILILFVAYCSCILLDSFQAIK